MHKRQVAPYLAIAAAFGICISFEYDVLEAAVVALVCGFAVQAYMLITDHGTGGNWRVAHADLGDDWQLLVHRDEKLNAKAIARLSFDVLSVPDEPLSDNHVKNLISFLGTSGVLHITDDAEKTTLSVTTAAKKLEQPEDIAAINFAGMEHDRSKLLSVFDLMPREHIPPSSKRLELTASELGCAD